MAFFEPPPPVEPPDEDEERPEWIGPPRNVVGAAVPIRLVLAKTADVAVAVIDATAYPTGFTFKVAVRTRAYDELEDPAGFDDLLALRYRHLRGRGSDLPPELFRFGIELADGRKATTVGGRPSGAPDAPPVPPVLLERAGGGGPGEWDQEYWVWPLPPEGPLAFVCEWPARGIALTRKEVDARLVLDAAAQAEPLWDEPSGPSAGGTWSSFP